MTAKTKTIILTLALSPFILAPCCGAPPTCEELRQTGEQECFAAQEAGGCTEPNFRSRCDDTIDAGCGWPMFISECSCGEFIGPTGGAITTGTATFSYRPGPPMLPDGHTGPGYDVE